VERVLKMVDGVLLIVDAYDGPMPQTRFVLQKTLELDLVPIVVINKVDRSDARPHEVLDLVLELFMDLGARDDQLDFPVIYASARQKIASENPDELMEFLRDPEQRQGDFKALMKAIRDRVPAPKGDIDGAFQLLISNIDYDNYLGRIAIGRIERGQVRQGQNVVVCRRNHQPNSEAKIVMLFRFEGLKRVEIEEASAGEIICVAGITDINIGDTLCDPDKVEPVPFVDIDEPTLSMTFSVNDSPFAGREGRFVTSRHLRERLWREVETNVSMQVEETDTTEAFIVKGRGELHLSILIETMRREGYEFQVGKPKVIVREIDGRPSEPVERIMIDVPESYMGLVIEQLGNRKAEMKNMMPPVQGWVRMEFLVPSRGLIGYRSTFLTDTKGNGIMNSVIVGYEPWKGEIETRNHGVLVAWETGETVAYGLYNAQERGTLFVGPGTPVYKGMIVGMTPKKDDIDVNVCKRKHVTNMRASGSDEALRLTPPTIFSLEQCLEFVADDELVEVTPKSIRLRKRILSPEARARLRSQQRSV
jgi:GTP-binding protein